MLIGHSALIAAPTQYSSIPFNVKALKLLVAEAGAAKQSGDYNASWEQEAEEEDDDGDGDGADWEDDGPAFLKTGPRPTDEFGFLSGAPCSLFAALVRDARANRLARDTDMMGPGGFDDTFGDDDDDDDDTDDPIALLDMQAHLTGLLRQTYAQHDGFGALAGALTQDEMATLGGLLS